MRRSLSRRVKLSLVAGVSTAALALATVPASAVTVQWTLRDRYIPTLTQCNNEGWSGFNYGYWADWICVQESGSYYLYITYQGAIANGYQMAVASTGYKAFVANWSTSNGTRIESGPGFGYSNDNEWGLQHWSDGTVSLFTMLNDRSCIAADTTEASHYLIEWGCVPTSTERFRVLPGDYTEYMKFESIAYPGECINSANDGVMLLGACRGSGSNWRLDDGS